MDKTQYSDNWFTAVEKKSILKSDHIRISIAVLLPWEVRTALNLAIDCDNAEFWE